jgi:HK97 family phage portal protein
VGLFNWRKKEQRNMDKKTSDFIHGVDMDSANQSNSGIDVDENESLKITTVYACVKVIAETIASLPLCLMKEETNGDNSRAKQHPLYSVLYGIPNDEMTSFTFREMLMTNLLLWGNAYALIKRDRYGHVVSLYPLKSKNMTVERDSVTRNIKYTYSNGVRTKVYTPRQILHIPAFTFDGVLGVSPITYAREAMGLALATEEFGARFFGNGARPGGVLEHPGTVKDPAKLRDSWNQVYQGTKNSHKVAVLEEGMKYHEIGMSPEDSQFLQTRQFQIAEICRIFRVPPHMIGDLSRSTFSNIEHQSIDFITHTIRPWLVRWEQAISRSLLNSEERSIYYARFNVNGLMRGDFTSRMSGYAIARQNGWMSANEIRQLEDMNKIPAEEGGDLYLLNGNMITANTAQQKEKEVGVITNEVNEGGYNGANETGT